MFGSTVLEVAIGMTFCFASVALITSTLQEALASLLRLRTGSLLAGIKTMLNDPQFAGLARSVYEHALVNPHDDGMAAKAGALTNKPSYIEPAHFAVALIDALHTRGGAPESVAAGMASLRDGIAKIPDEQLKRVLTSIHKRAGDDLGRFQAGVEGWFNGAMERVSGAYKRRAQLTGVLITLVLAVVCDIDSIHLFRALWLHPVLTAKLGALPATLDKPTLDLLWSLPIGWQSVPSGLDMWSAKVGGWLLTASTALFGAPFWFDMLQRVVQVRSTGAKPSERHAEEHAGAPASAVDVVPRARP
ncbi:MAG: hypothetical protein V4582_00795 [Pseudomonadota bacterium]